MKILAAAQLKELDQYTIQHEPIASIDLMERAATEFTNAITELIRTNEPVMVFCGMGNNGGDGLAIARMLIERGYLHVSAYVVRHSPNGSADFLVNEERLKNIAGIHYIETEFQIPLIPKQTVVIDAIFGSGLTRPIEGLTAATVTVLNNSNAIIYSVDVPSGMYCDQPNKSSDTVVQSDITFTFHAPKLSFLLPSAANYVPDFRVLDIGLNKTYSENLASPYSYLTHQTIQSAFKHRNKFSHKGTHGHALIAAGSYGKAGAAVLAVNAALHSGAGLVTACIPACAYNIVQTACPEAMVVADRTNDELSSLPEISAFSAIGVGPGIGISKNTVAFVEKLLENAAQPLVFDADALNILSENKQLLNRLPVNAILTPHPGEFKRLAGEWTDDLHKLELQREFAATYNTTIVLKGAHTSIALPNGQIFFNSTGNAGMAKGGSGDVLTGVIASLLAQGYSPANAAIIGVFVHGMAGDYAATYLSQTGMSAGDIIRYLPEAFSVFE
ncbi:MAG: NAD(P)H-hydrate dehydratase [Chitinophagales bacterium]|nr:NAD(P)H-hydrate dehydratase [Chitinophagales bacterium]